MSAPAPRPAQTDFRQHFQVETPEHVTLDYEIAGLGSRALASIGDHCLLLLWLLGLQIILSPLARAARGFGGVTWIILGFLSAWGYFALFEGLRRGQTPAKRMLGIRVVMDTGHPVTLSAAIVRNLVRAADFMPVSYFFGAVAIALGPRSKRLGDLAAGTIVVRDRPHERRLEASVPKPQATTLGAPRLAEAEFRLLSGYRSRAAELAPAARQRLASVLLDRVGQRYADLGGTAEEILEQIFELETSRRAAGSHVTAALDSAAQLVRRQRSRWDDFATVAERASKDGLDSFAAEELPAFAAAYREVAADLARARTYHADPATEAELERLVAAGHNVLYRDQRHTLRRIWQEISREFPAAVIRSRRTVCFALLAFWVPALSGFMLLRERPDLAEAVLPESMLERADAGEARKRAGHGYYEAEAGDRPLMAAEIITNNVQVAFFCFAGGIFFGFGSMFSLGFNGLILGASAGHFANRNLLDYLGRFVVGHGVLELNAICLAGAAGFLLGRAIIAPGDLPRGDALRLAGQSAVRIVGMAVVMLLVAGLIEGLVSAGRGGWSERLAYSGASAVFLVLYLLSGMRGESGVRRGAGAGPARSSPALTAAGR